MEPVLLGEDSMVRRVHPGADAAERLPKENDAADVPAQEPLS